MKILITGGAGYLGSVMVPMMLNEGWKITVVDSFIYNQHSLLDHCYNPNLKIVRGDVRDERLMLKLMENQDYILPLACIVGMPACDKKPIEARQINLDAVKFIMDNRKPEQRVIFPTTESGYGSVACGKRCTERTPLRPISLYGRLKTEAESYVLMMGDCVTLRLGTVFGASNRMRLDLLVNDFVYRALTDRNVTLFESNFRRNYVHIRDVARVFIFSIKNFDRMKNEPYNVGLDGAYNKEELCAEIKKVIPNFWYSVYSGKDKIEDVDRRNYIVSHEKLRRVGFEAKTTIQEGILEIIKACGILSRNQFTNI